MTVAQPPTIPALGTIPNRSQTPETFTINFQAFLDVFGSILTALGSANTITYNNAIEAYNGAVNAINSPSTSATSTTSMSIATGTQTFTIQTGKLFALGQFATVAYTTDPTKLMHGIITAYNSGTGSMTVQVYRINGTGGPFTAWTIAVSGPQAAVGAQTQSIPAAAMRGRITNGASFSISEAPTYKNMICTLDFPDTGITYAQFEIMMPKSWDLGALTFQPVWKGPSAGSVLWGLQAVAIGDGESLDAAFGTAQTVVDTWISAALTQQTGPVSAAITAGGTLAAGKRVQFQLYRDPTHASDTIAGVVSLLDIVLGYTTNAPNDA